MTASAHRPHHTLLGIGLMLAAMAVLPFLDVVAKHLGRQAGPAGADSFGATRRRFGKGGNRPDFVTVRPPETNKNRARCDGKR